MTPKETKNLVKKAMTRDTDAFTVLIQLHMKNMYRVGLAILMNDEDVEDLGGKTVWKKMDALTNEEMERYYLIYYGASLDTKGGYRGRYLSGMEQKQYKELLAAYEAGTANPRWEIPLIDTPKDFTGEHLAFCLSDANFYLPETPLSDEDILQIIDLEKKALYSITILRHQWETGLRENMPRRE